MEKKEKIFDIKDRTFQFSIDIVSLFRSLDTKRTENYVLGKQVLRSGTSIGSMCEEAVSGESNADFIHKYTIALKEARETHHWLRLMVATNMITGERAKEIVQESFEIKNILGAIVVKLKNKNKDKK